MPVLVSGSLAFQDPKRNITTSKAAIAVKLPAMERNVISRHVQPRIEWAIGQLINGREIDEQVERVQLGIGLTGGVSLEVRRRDAASMKFPTRLRAWLRSSSSGPMWIDWVGHAFAQAGPRPSCWRS